MCYKGRNPKHDNKIAIGGVMAEDLHKKIGDTVICTYGDSSYEFIITGFIQSGTNAGFTPEITTKGYRHLCSTFKNNQINLYLRKGVKSDDYIKYIESKYQNDIVKTVNMKKMIHSMLGIYSNIVSIVGVVILVVTLVIIALILLLITKSYLIKYKEELGVQKAIGYTSNQLIIQTILSFIPVVFVGVVFGIILSKLYTNEFLSIIFRSLGIMKLNFYVPMLYLIIISIVITLFSTLVIVLESKKINRL